MTKHWPLHPHGYFAHSSGRVALYAASDFYDEANHVVAERDRRVRELEEALRWALPCAAQWVSASEAAGRHVSVQRASLERARAVIGGSDPAGRADQEESEP